MDKSTYDICIIGGGINGTGIARDAVGRGYKVLLLEQHDLANATSSASTKLIHGGLRYLEHFQFGLVKKALKERDILMHIAPHIIWPMRFILPHAPSIRPFWMIRLGVWIYDYIYKSKKLKKSIKTNIKNKILNKKFNIGIAYSDCWVDDARLVILNAMDAQSRGATIKTNTKCDNITHDGETWAIQTNTGETHHAQTIINASGPWASDLITNHTEPNTDIKNTALRLVKGSHIVIPKLYDEPESYILQNDDKRIVFTIPYEDHYTLVGTTDIDTDNNPNTVPKIDDDEISYLKSILNKYFNKNIKGIDIIHTYSGIRPLIYSDKSDASYASRDYKLDLQTIDGSPLLSVFGGKITTYRTLAQEAMDMIDMQFHNAPRHWTHREKLPGGDINDDDDLQQYTREQCTAYPFLSHSLIQRYAKTYGTNMQIILNDVHGLDDMGQNIGGGVYGRELDYLIAYEFATTGDDVLWRRTKLGLHLDQDTQTTIHNYMNEKTADKAE